MKGNSWSPTKSYVNKGDSLIYASAIDIPSELGDEPLGSYTLGHKIRKHLMLKIFGRRYFRAFIIKPPPEFKDPATRYIPKQPNSSQQTTYSPYGIFDTPTGLPSQNLITLETLDGKKDITYNIKEGSFSVGKRGPKELVSLDFLGRLVYETHTIYIGSKKVTRLWGYDQTRHYVAALLFEFGKKYHLTIAQGRGQKADLYNGLPERNRISLQITTKGIRVIWKQNHVMPSSPLISGCFKQGGDGYKNETDISVGDVKGTGVFEANYKMRWAELWLNKVFDLPTAPRNEPPKIASDDPEAEKEATKAREKFLSVESISYAFQDIHEPQIFALICLDPANVTNNGSTAQCHAFLCRDALVCRNLVLALHKVIDVHRLDRTEAASTMAYLNPGEFGRPREPCSRSQSFNEIILEPYMNRQELGAPRNGFGFGDLHPKEIEIR